MHHGKFKENFMVTFLLKVWQRQLHAPDEHTHSVVTPAHRKMPRAAA
jgi:hypothetical protein